ncbi:DEAD-domain-containing protein [Laetiporus sulphureus 93-53]|uniref:ATP-dependent RNA helicase n=1 Tax=Laetiporus sulphureus 93-53 TaxID=1314785 RepID=A0A165GX58_9APHY|nr:DEAD-domain-containing protein [Laetiporus sulphureus 93-53]KZT10950.1 DEAD-domain-containing protein [Laetiporus sulphureus 93-53]
MDDGLVLNLVQDDQSTVRKPSRQAKKGGRWTDRLKAKRVTQRKPRSDEPTVAQEPTDIPLPRPTKRARNEYTPSRTEHVEERTPAITRPPTQIISSLFSFNPKVEQPKQSSLPKACFRPSNAPLADSSTFAGLGLDPLIVAHLSSKMDITKPTSIQRAALPVLLSSGPHSVSDRDIFIQSQTGSGKTLSFLLPIIQDLLPLSSLSYIDRSIGTLAIVIAPTRELAKQISDVLDVLLNLRLRPPDDSAESPDTAPRLTRWLVSGLLTGGSTRTHEKARLRKGVPILVSTPGRLLDHLQNTASFNVSKCRWLVLDEADRLMELGFEETIQGILRGLDGRRKLAMQAVEEGRTMEVGGWDWQKQRRTILCSATIREDVQKLAGTTLKDPVVIKATESDLPASVSDDPETDKAVMPSLTSSQRFTPPSQLTQRYVIVPLKLRLVTLVALLRSLLAQASGRRGTKIIVFLSCTDSVDFHWTLLGGTSMNDEQGASNIDSEAETTQDEDSNAPRRTTKVRRPGAGKVEAKCALLPDTSVFRLHGSLPLQTRQASLRGFSSVPSSKTSGSTSSILLCTSVASRGLDLPLVRAVIQYDLPTEGGATEYVHRVGRTARVGKGGEAWSFVEPSEIEWVKWVDAKMQGDTKPVGEEADQKKSVGPQGIPMESVLRSGFGGEGDEYEERATEVQLSFERWVLRGKHNAEMARKAYLSHMRAYATHPSDEKHIFHIRHLHLGHLAKAFALREAPTAVTSASAKPYFKQKKSAAQHIASGKTARRRKRGQDSDDDFDIADSEKRMEKVVRAQGRLTKKAGKMVSSGVSEFQIADGYALERLVQTSRT